MTHEERRKRRLCIAEDARKLLDQGLRKHEITGILSQQYNVGASTVELAYKEFQIKFANFSIKKANATEKASSADALSEKARDIAEYLQNSDKTYREIASILNVTRQYVQIVHKRLLQDGFDVPLRKEVADRMRIAREQKIRQQEELFVEKFLETNELEDSADFAQISLLRAKRVLRNKKLNATGLIVDKEICKQYPNQRITRRLAYIIADLFNPDIPVGHIAKKWKKPAPFVFNLMAECKKAGIPIPDHVDGRSIADYPDRANKRICQKCGNEFRTFAKLEDGTRVRMWHGRKECINCKPFQGNKKDENAKSTTDNDLQESAIKEGQAA